jgi:hypothetical protein
MLANGVDIRTAQGRLGHADPRLTLAIYAQAVEDADRRAAETIGAVFLGGGRGDSVGAEMRREDRIKPSPYRRSQASVPTSR